MQKHYKGIIAPTKKARRNRRMGDGFISARIDSDLKKRWLAALTMGRRTGQTDAFLNLISAYCEATEKQGRQPEFPLEVRTKPPAQKA